MQQLAQDRRALLRYLLQDLKARGKDVLLPVGCSDFDEWLLDALSVERLLKQLRSDPPTLDLINACVSASTLSPGRSSLATPPRGSSSLAAAGEEGGIVDFRTLMSREGTPGGTPATVPGATADDDEDSRAPRLRLRSLQVAGLAEYQLKELAYAIFLSCGGAAASRGLLADLRACLELNETRAAELARITEVVGSQGVTSLATLEMHVKLLQLVRPTAFDSFRNFVKWRETVTSVVWLVLSQAVRDGWSGGGAAAPPDASARTLLARLKGGLRRLDVRVADDYDDAEYGEAAEAVFAAADALAQRCKTGWSFPWGLRARLAELLLRGIFDTLDEGQYNDHRQELLKLLQGGVWRQLGITPDVHSAVFAWVHYRQFALSQELLLLEVARQAVQAVRGGGGGGGVSSREGSPQPAANGDAGGDPFPLEVMECVAHSVCATLSNYHATVEDPRVMKGLIGLLDAAEAACGRRDQLPALLQGCIAASVEAAFEASLAELSTNVDAEEDRIVLLAAASTELFRAEAATYAPLLTAHQPAARRIAAAALHEVYGARMLPWLIGVNGLTKSALEAIRASMALEELLLEECRERGDPPTPWGTVERLSPLLYTWAQGQITMLGGWLDRILAAEDWARVSKQRAHGSRSVVETIKIVTETLEALFDMRLAIPAGVVRCLTEGVDLAMQKYCDFVRSQVGTPAAIVPPRPPLTRYKRELAVAAEGQAAAAAGGQAPSGLAKGRSKVSEVNINWLPPLGATKEERRVVSLPYDSLVVRLNSVQHLLDSLAGLERMVVDRWDDGRPSSAKAREGRHAYDWIAGLFDGARRAAQRARDHLVNFIAIRLVYGELRELIFERLYRFHVQVSRLELVLQELDRLLADICAHVHDALPPHLGRGVCAALAAAVQSVLLDGGPYRLFTPQDVDMLEVDMAQMRAVFYADGEGISLEEVDALCRSLSDVVDLMQLDTGLIIQNLKQAKHTLGKHGKSPRGTPAAMDPDVLLRILCHRADHAASKYLKKEHKIPKKIPGSLSTSVSDITHKATGGLLRRGKTA